MSEVWAAMTKSKRASFSSASWPTFYHPFVTQF